MGHEAKPGRDASYGVLERSITARPASVYQTGATSENPVRAKFAEFFFPDVG